MAIFRIPAGQERSLSQVNSGEFFGNVYASFNLDLRSNPGYIKNSRKLIRGFDEQSENANTATATFDQVGAIESFDDKIFIMSEDVFENTSLDPTDMDFTESSLNPEPTPYEDDMDVFNGFLFATAGNDMGRYDPNASPKWDNDWWTDTLGESTLPGDKNVLEVAQIGQPILIIGSGNEIITLDTSNTVNRGNSTPTVREDQEIVWIKSTNNRIWIGCQSLYPNGNALIYEWNGARDVPQAVYTVQARASLSGFVINNVVYSVLSNGEIVGYSGNGFQRVAQFPIYNSSEVMDENTFTDEKWCNKNGTTVHKGKALIAIHAKTEKGNFTLLENQMSGVWEFNPDNGNLYHRYSPTIDGYGQSLVESAGAIKAFENHKSSLLCGFETEINLNSEGALFYEDLEDTTDHKGWFTTPWLTSDQLDEVWKNVVGRMTPLTTGQVVAKYRTGKKDSYPLNIGVTWQSTTTFTSTAGDMSNAEVGEEVFVINGNQGGNSARITDISLDSGTYTVTLDQSIGASSGEARVFIQNFYKIATWDDTNTQIHTGLIGARSNLVQLKFEMNGTGDEPEIEQIILGTDTNRFAKR